MSKHHFGFMHKIALWALVFASGWFLMMTELVGARVLTPFFGNTIYVWGSVIAIFLLAMAIGYAIGGRITRKCQSPIIPSIFAVAAGLYVAANPLYQDSLSAYLYNTGLHVKWGALIAATVLYAVPMALLGGISPYCIQIATSSHTEVGTRAGTLYAVSTIGSFIGCIVTAFIFIPGFSLVQITLFGGIALAAIAVAVAFILTNRAKLAFCIALILVMVAGFAIYRVSENPWHSDIKAYEYPINGRVLSRISPEDLGPVLKEAQAEAAKEAEKYMALDRRVLLETETPYHHISVIQEGPIRRLFFGKPDYHGAQNTMDLRKLSWHVSEYTHLSFAGLLYRPLPKRVCVIGVGGAVIPRALELCSPGVKVDAVEIDPTVINVARKYFFWRPSKNVHVYTQDGRSFINWALMNGKPKYDWIIIDAYNDDYVPFHLTTKEFIATLQRMLSPDGIIASNMCIDDDLYGCEARTFEAVFGNVNAFVGKRSGNIILVSQNGRKKPLAIDEAKVNAERLRLPSESQIDPRFLLSCMWEGRNWSEKGPILTDTWAPVENLIE